jgi:uncharacterized membrane protein
VTTEADPAQNNTVEVTATVIINAPAHRVYTAFTAWERQGEWIPFTKVRITDGDGGEGSTLEAITAIGPAVLTDIISIEKLDPPFEVRVMHTGKVLRGPGVMRCTPMGTNRTQMVWHEWFQLPGGLAGKFAGPVLWPTSKVSLTQALKRFGRLVEAGTLP